MSRFAARSNRHAPDQMTVKANAVAAFAKVSTAPLHTMTDAMVDSITASHARRGTPQFVKLRAALDKVLAERRERETAA